MRIYLDNCCFNRPFDDQSALAVRLETEAILDVQENIISGHHSLGWSYILDFENSTNPYSERQAETLRWKALAESFVSESAAILKKMSELVVLGLKPIDALHVSCAIALECDCFMTVDKGILKKADKVSQITIINPVNAVIHWESQQ